MNYHELSNLEQLIYYLRVSMCWECQHALTWYSVSESKPSCHQAISYGWGLIRGSTDEEFTSKFTLIVSRIYFLAVTGQRSPLATRSLLQSLVRLFHGNLLSHSWQGKERLPASLLGVLHNGIEYYYAFCHVLLVRSQSQDISIHKEGRLCESMSTRGWGSRVCQPQAVSLFTASRKWTPGIPDVSISVNIPRPFTSLGIYICICMWLKCPLLPHLSSNSSPVCFTLEKFNQTLLCNTSVLRAHIYGHAHYLSISVQYSRLQNRA